MQVVEVTNKHHKKAFLQLPESIYANDPNWIHPLNQDIEMVFDTQKNKFFRHGKCIRWLLLNENDVVVGRIAAFIDHKTATKNNNQPTGGIGFFECVNQQSYAFLLFDTARNWLSEQGMEAMDGPINFGERDSWWGLLTEGFLPPPYKMNYNPPYYQQFFENYGFEVYFKQLCYGLKVSNQLQSKFYERHAAIKADTNYHAEHIKKNQLARFAEDFRTIYNKAWVKHGSGKELEQKQVFQFFKKMKPVIDEKIIWYVYYKDEPVAFWINLPDINQIFKHFNGKFGWIEKLRFLWMLKTRKTRRMIGLVFGVVPEHQGKGVDSFMIVEGANLIQKRILYDDFEMQWIGDFNPKMISVAESLGTWPTRTLITYRYLFDRNKPFTRHPIIS
jgi:hypothetical protein